MRPAGPLCKVTLHPRTPNPELAQIAVEIVPAFFRLQCDPLPVIRGDALTSESEAPRVEGGSEFTFLLYNFPLTLVYMVPSITHVLRADFAKGLSFFWLSVEDGSSSSVLNPASLFSAKLELRCLPIPRLQNRKSLVNEASLEAQCSTAATRYCLLCLPL